MFFSDKFEVEPELIKEYGAIDISLVCDIPLFVDPMLIFNSDKPAYKKLHNKIIRYFHFLYKKSKEGLNLKEINAWFNFSEVHNNWLGYSMSGNKGLALGKKYAEFLYNHIEFAVNTNGISDSEHIEKIMLLYEGSGKDKISDLTVNLIKGFLCEYTEKFSKTYIRSDLCKMLPVEKAYFNYKTESFVSKEYFLPYIYNEKGKVEYVLLTPRDILREDEPSINRDNFYNNYDRIRNAIDNSTLRVYVNNYIGKAILDYEERQRDRHSKIKESTIRKIEIEAFKDLVQEYPQLYDYYIRLRENDTTQIRNQSFDEVDKQNDKFIISTRKLISVFKQNEYQYTEDLSAREEAKKRIRYLKHIIEDCDGYKNLYIKGQRIAKEADLQRLFRLVWYGTSFQVDAETNNGRGQTDFIISKGNQNQNIVEFKLASNSTLDHVFTQVKIYEKSNNTDGSLIAIFYFTEEEYFKTIKIIKNVGYEHLIDESIFLIDCRNDNKPSASVA